MIVWIAAASCLLALLPAVLFLRNLALYAPPPLAKWASAGSLLRVNPRAQ